MKSLQNYKAYQEVFDFIASSNPAKVLVFNPSEEAKQRVSELIEREKNEELSAEENSENDSKLIYFSKSNNFTVK